MTTGSATFVSSNSPNGVPTRVESTSRHALPTCTCRQSCATTTPATVIETSTASGTATSTGIINASKGTATRASPNPNVERIKVARKITAGTAIVVSTISISFGQPRPKRLATAGPFRSIFGVPGVALAPIAGDRCELRTLDG